MAPPNLRCYRATQAGNLRNILSGTVRCHFLVALLLLRGTVMKKLAIAIAAIALIGTPAFAADMALKAPPPAPAPVYNWTGWYVGVNAGASFGNAKTDFNGAPVTTFLGTVVTGGFASSEREYPDGFIGGGQIGYNW